MTWDALSLEVAGMFAEFASNAELDAQITIEWWLANRAAKKREREAERYRWMVSSPAGRERVYAYRRKQVSEFRKRKRATDPVWAARQRELNRIKNRNWRERKKQQELQRAA